MHFWIQPKNLWVYKCLLIKAWDIASESVGGYGFVPLNSGLLRSLSTVATSQKLSSKPCWLKLVCIILPSLYLLWVGLLLHSFLGVSCPLFTYLSASHITILTPLSCGGGLSVSPLGDHQGTPILQMKKLMFKEVMLPFCNCIWAQIF